MNKFILTCLNALLLALCLSAQSGGGMVTVSGNITSISTGAPVANWEIFAFGSDPQDSTLYGFGVGTTDADGHYAITFSLPASIGEVNVWVQSFCPNAPGLQFATVPIVNGQASADFAVCADPPPVPDCFAWANATPTGNRSYSFYAYYEALDSSAAASYLWDFGDGTTSTEANPMHTFAGTDSVFLVTLTITGANGCTATTETPIYIFDFPPFPYCWLSPNAEPLDSLTYRFSADLFSLDSNAVATAYFWDFGDGSTSTEAVPVHSYAQAGVYFVSLHVTSNTGCEAEIQFPVGTGFPPFPDCQAYLVYEQTDTLTFEFSAMAFGFNGDSTLLGNYHWDFGDSTFSTEANPTHTYALPGIYTVQLTALTDDSCTVHICDVVFAIDCPIDTFWYGCQAMFEVVYEGLDSLGVPGNPFTLHFRDVSFGAVTSRTWDFGDGTTSTEANPVHTYAAEGSYLVTLSITTADGCESDIAFVVFAGNNFPWTAELDCQALFIPLPDSIGGQGIQFVDLSYSTSPIQSWTWSFGDGSSSTEQYPFHVYAQPGVYNVTLQISADSCDSEITFMIDTESPWNFNRVPAHLGLSSQVTAAPEAPVFEKLSLMPNPLSTEGTLIFDSKTGFDYQLRILDISGKAVLSQQKIAQAGTNTVRLNTGNLVPGLYVVQLLGAEKVEVVKFVKQ